MLLVDVHVPFLCATVEVLNSHATNVTFHLLILHVLLL